MVEADETQADVMADALGLECNACSGEFPKEQIWNKCSANAICGDNRGRGGPIGARKRIGSAKQAAARARLFEIQ